MRLLIYRSEIQIQKFLMAILLRSLGNLIAAIALFGAKVIDFSRDRGGDSKIYDSQSPKSSFDSGTTILKF